MRRYAEEPKFNVNASVSRVAEGLIQSAAKKQSVAL